MTDGWAQSWTVYFPYEHVFISSHSCCQRYPGATFRNASFSSLSLGGIGVRTELPASLTLVMCFMCLGRARVQICASIWGGEGRYSVRDHGLSVDSCQPWAVWSKTNTYHKHARIHGSAYNSGHIYATQVYLSLVSELRWVGKRVLVAADVNLPHQIVDLLFLKVQILSWLNIGVLSWLAHAARTYQSMHLH